MFLNFVIGCSIRFASYAEVTQDSGIYHVLQVRDNTPAQHAGLISFRDYIIASPSAQITRPEDLQALIEKHEGQWLSLVIYNVDLEATRLVQIRPSVQRNEVCEQRETGLLGCDIGYGYLHKIPLPMLHNERRTSFVEESRRPTLQPPRPLLTTPELPVPSTNSGPKSSDLRLENATNVLEDELSSANVTEHDIARPPPPPVSHDVAAFSTASTSVHASDSSSTRNYMNAVDTINDPHQMQHNISRSRFSEPSIKPANSEYNPELLALAADLLSPAHHRRSSSLSSPLASVNIQTLPVEVVTRSKNFEYSTFVEKLPSPKALNEHDPHMSTDTAYMSPEHLHHVEPPEPIEPLDFDLQLEHRQKVAQDKAVDQSGSFLVEANPLEGAREMDVRQYYSTAATTETRLYKQAEEPKLVRTAPPVDEVPFTPFHSAERLEPSRDTSRTGSSITNLQTQGHLTTAEREELLHTYQTSVPNSENVSKHVIGPPSNSSSLPPDFSTSAGSFNAKITPDEMINTQIEINNDFCDNASNLEKVTLHDFLTHSPLPSDGLASASYIRPSLHNDHNSAGTVTANEDSTAYRHDTHPNAVKSTIDAVDMPSITCGTSQRLCKADDDSSAAIGNSQDANVGHYSPILQRTSETIVQQHPTPHKAEVFVESLFSDVSLSPEESTKLLGSAFKEIPKTTTSKLAARSSSQSAPMGPKAAFTPSNRTDGVTDSEIPCDEGQVFSRNASKDSSDGVPNNINVNDDVRRTKNATRQDMYNTIQQMNPTYNYPDEKSLL